MPKDYDADLIAEKLHGVSPDIRRVSAFSKRGDGIQPFLLSTTRLLTTEEMISLCRELAVVLRREIPERRAGWAARILAGNLPAMIMGDYYIGWAGRSDKWELREGQERKATDRGDWLEFRDHLRVALAAHGTEGKRTGDSGDFVMSNMDNGPLEQTLYINNPEFLTEELIATIQRVLKNVSPDGVVEIAPAFGDGFENLWEGVNVRTDGVEEKWDRAEAEQLLGDRLKIPRYARDDS